MNYLKPITKSIYRRLRKMKVSAEKTTQNFDNRGIGVVEIILILVVLIGLVLIFKSQLTELVKTIFDKITSESSGI